ncbi:MAG: hypothetical protein ABR961_03310 [Thermoanaerobaculaceae bacterium]|jgi:hypothetical protein
MSEQGKSLTADVLAGLGVVCLSAGAWMIYTPAGLLVGGALLILIGVKLERA